MAVTQPQSYRWRPSINFITQRFAVQKAGNINGVFDAEALFGSWEFSSREKLRAMFPIGTLGQIRVLINSLARNKIKTMDKRQ